MINNAYDPLDNLKHLWAKMVWADTALGYRTFEAEVTCSALLICYHVQSLRFRVFSNSDPRIDITDLCSEQFISEVKAMIFSHDAAMAHAKTIQDQEAEL